MYSKLLVLLVIINFISATNQTLLNPYGEDTLMNAVEHRTNYQGVQATRNASYIDRAENVIRLPVIQSSETKRDKKKWKKAPKRTIQKIIKKTKQKPKKILVMKMTSPTILPVHESYDLGQEELSQWKDDSTTAPSNQKKRYNKNKFNTKVARYPMPFQRLQKMRNHNKRDTYGFN